MKLKMINAAALILQFDQECSRLYSKLREKYIFTRDNTALVYKYNNGTHIDIKALNENREEVDGDKFICVEEFNIENITVYITYGEENLAMRISVTIDKQDNQYFVDFYDIFNFFQINELRNTSFLDISNEQDIVKIVRRYGEFLHLYLEIIMDLSIDENKLKQFIEFFEQKYKKITFMQAWNTSRGDSHFEKGDYKKAVKTYSKVLPVLSHIQTQKYQQSIKAIGNKDIEIELLKKFELEKDLYYFKKAKIVIINDSR